METVECHLMEQSTSYLLRGRASWNLWNTKVYTSTYILCMWVNGFDENRTEIYTDWLYRSPCLDPPTSSVCAPNRSELAELRTSIRCNFSNSV